MKSSHWIMHITIGWKPFLLVRTHPHLIMTIEFLILQSQRLLNAQRKPWLLDQDYNHWSVGEKLMLYHDIQQEPISIFNFFFIFFIFFFCVFWMYHRLLNICPIFSLWNLLIHDILLKNWDIFILYSIHVNYINLLYACELYCV